jgi:hypothetical protein
MKMTQKKRLVLRHETLRALAGVALREVASGGAVNNTVDAQGHGQSCTSVCDTGGGGGGKPQ